MPIVVIIDSAVARCILTKSGSVVCVLMLAEETADGGDTFLAGLLSRAWTV
jgi:hypothetical protein